PPAAPPPPDGPEGGEPPKSPIERAAGLPLNDFGNGQRFIIHFGEDVMWVPRVGWFTWAGTHWAADPDGLAVRSRAQKLAELIEKETAHIRVRGVTGELIEECAQLEGRYSDLLDELAKPGLPEEAKAPLKLERDEVLSRLRLLEPQMKRRTDAIGKRLTHAKNAGNSGPLTHMLEESQTALAVPVDALDADPLSICAQNGILKFGVEHGTAVQTFLPHEANPDARAARMTKIMPVDYKPGARAPEWEKFLLRILPDREDREFLQRFFGLSMTGVTIQAFLFLYGVGANGKSVLVDTVARILGAYAATARIESLTGSNRRGGGDATPDLIPLVGARMVRTSEPDEGQRLQEGLIKELTGGEPINVRALHGDFFEVHPKFKLTMSGNHKPEIRGTDDGIWRRVLLVPFEVQIPEAERDAKLGDKLFAEGPGILNWLIEGLCDYLERGLDPPQKVLDATREYREDSDPVGTFLTRCTVVTGDAGETILARDLVAAFNYFRAENGDSQWQPQTVAKHLKDKSRSWRHPATGLGFHAVKASVSRYDGLRLADDFGHRFKNAPRDASGKVLGLFTEAEQ
ncbi:DNA primase family protein, partial [Vannielia litorea]|uniref:DNA primase family protein n=1 Tax=Vannielia litorea TaxID=1217970 RepID=UPI001BCB16C5